MAAPEDAYIRIFIGGLDVSPLVEFAKTQFQVVASAQPGTCTVVLRQPKNSFEASFLPSMTPGQVIELTINDHRMWRGYAFTVDKGYAFPDSPEKEFTFSGVDLNILFDKLIFYNHADPTRSLDGGGTYEREKTDGGYVVNVPRHTSDRSYIITMMADTDISTISPTIDYQTLVSDVGQLNPDGSFTPPTPGLTWRAFMEDVSRNVNRSTPGSVVWYINPDGRLVYCEQDYNIAPFSVGDDDETQEVMVRDLRLTTDISRIKNDVLIFTGNLDPQPGATQSRLLYRHATNDSSISTYGRFQYSEVLSESWLQGAINVRASKILTQEGIPAGRAEFTLHRLAPDGDPDSFLWPGQIINIYSGAHGVLENYPIRSISMRFLTPTTVEYRVACSYDTQDPWGLLLALKRPAVRGLSQPAFKIIDRTKSPPDPLDPTETYTLVKEFPRSLGGHLWQCSYAYIRYSLVVFIGGSRKVSVPEEGSTVGFIETSPGTGVFYMDAAGTPYVEYHVWHNIDNQ